MGPRSEGLYADADGRITICRLIWKSLSGSGISVTRSGSRYTFTSKEHAGIPRIAPVQKRCAGWRYDADLGTRRLADDDDRRKGSRHLLYAISRRKPMEAKIIRASEDGIVEGIPFDQLPATASMSVNGYYRRQRHGRSRAFTGHLPCVRRAADRPRCDPCFAVHHDRKRPDSPVCSSANVLKKFRVVAHKADADTGTAQGDATLGLARCMAFIKVASWSIPIPPGRMAVLQRRYHARGNDWTSAGTRAKHGLLA